VEYRALTRATDSPTARRAVGLAGFWFLRLAIPFMLIRWWIKFGKIKTDDPDFSQARGTTYIVAAVWFVALGTAVFFR
jgi:hypothetical protein